MKQLASFEGYEVIPSFTEAVRTSGEPMSLADRDLRDLLAWGDGGNRIADHYLAGLEPVLGSGLQVRRARKLDRFTRFDGRIHGDVPSPADAGALSPTSLETYAECPRRYLMERVLRIEVRDRPEAIVTIEPSTKGTLVHSILEQFIADQLRLPRGERIAPTTPWSPTDHSRLDAIAEQVFAAYEDQGLTGRPLLWGLARATIVRELHRFLVEDDRYRAHGGLVPERVELQFGPGHGVPVAIELPGGRTITFKGFADRVDVASDGSASVIDYKTGGAWGFEESDRDPLARGAKLQLPVYGLAARSRLGNVPVHVAYWFVSEKGNFRQIRYALDSAAMERFSEVVTVLVDGVEQGLFPARPGDKNKNCKFCDFESMCPGDREVSWNKVRDAPGTGQLCGLDRGTERSGGRCVVTQLAFDLIGAAPDEHEGDVTEEVRDAPSSAGEGAGSAGQGTAGAGDDAAADAEADSSFDDTADSSGQADSSFDDAADSSGQADSSFDDEADSSFGDAADKSGDAAARAEVLTGLDRSLFVEAGAGTGKTTALVGRVLALVTSGVARLSRIAAITFTEAAAAELRDRVYEALEQAAAGNDEALRADGLVGGPVDGSCRSHPTARAEGSGALGLHELHRHAPGPGARLELRRRPRRRSTAPRSAPSTALPSGS